MTTPVPRMSKGDARAIAAALGFHPDDEAAVDAAREVHDLGRRRPPPLTATHTAADAARAQAHGWEGHRTGSHVR